MARARIRMKQLQKLLDLTYRSNLSLREVAVLTGVSKTSVSEYLTRFRKSGISYEESLKYSDEALLACFEANKQEECEAYTTLTALFPGYAKRLKKKGMTKQFLWKEYRKHNPTGYHYSQFCHYFGVFLDSTDVTMKQKHDPGEKAFLDYTGEKISYLKNGKPELAEVFVAILGASELTYVEATESQKQEDFVRSTERALRYFGGVPRALVPDNLKSAVLKASKYEPELNPLFDDFSEYYRTSIIPARAYRPKDKALVENAVKLTYQRIFAPLYDKTYYSLNELNHAIREHLENHNTRKLTKLQISRRQLFDEIEKDHLKTLPSQNYPIKHFERRTVAPDYHIILSEDKHYYSVPWQYKRQKVKAVFDDRVVAIYDGEGIRIAQHPRVKKCGQYSTLAEHMPKHHRYFDSWSAEKFTSWASHIGPETQELITRLIASRKHEQQAYKSCAGILSLAKKHSAEYLNLACRKALNYGRIGYRDVKAYLQDLDVQRKEDSLDKSLLPFTEHENLRDASQYQ
jgi:transposase